MNLHVHYIKKNVSYKLAGEFFTISRSPESFQSMKKHIRGKKMIEKIDHKHPAFTEFSMF